jgi:hypothetical protein
MTYPIGIAGQPWTPEHRRAWLASQSPQRSYDPVVRRIEALADRFDVVRYGELSYDRPLPLFGLVSRNLSPTRPTALITGGVHGYETSGVLGALQFAETVAEDFAGQIDLVIAPCVSPWAYEVVNRWNPDATDPNRNFVPESKAPECRALMDWVQSLGPIHMHIDLHETTDSDNTEFRPAKAARDGLVDEQWAIPDGFYLVARTDRPTPAFQAAIRDAVAAVTHIADPDPSGRIIGVPLQQHGVIEYDAASLGLCMALTDAPFSTTTEVYPDSPRTTPRACADAQVAAVRAGLAFVVANQRPV